MGLVKWKSSKILAHLVKFKWGFSKICWQTSGHTVLGAISTWTLQFRRQCCNTIRGNRTPDLTVKLVHVSHHSKYVQRFQMPSRFFKEIQKRYQQNRYMLLVLQKNIWQYNNLKLYTVTVLPIFLRFKECIVTWYDDCTFLLVVFLIYMVKS